MGKKFCCQVYASISQSWIVVKGNGNVDEVYACGQNKNGMALGCEKNKDLKTLWQLHKWEEFPPSGNDDEDFIDIEIYPA